MKDLIDLKKVYWVKGIEKVNGKESVKIIPCAIKKQKDELKILNYTTNNEIKSKNIETAKKLFEEEYNLKDVKIKTASMNIEYDTEKILSYEIYWQPISALQLLKFTNIFRTKGEKKAIFATQKEVVKLANTTAKKLTEKYLGKQEQNQDAEELIF